MPVLRIHFVGGPFDGAFMDVPVESDLPTCWFLSRADADDMRGAFVLRFRRRSRGTAVRGRVARQTPGSVYVCPGCGGDVLLVRVLAFGVLSAAQSVVLQGERSVSGRKVATCAGCEWRGTVARTREAVVA